MKTKIIEAITFLGGLKAYIITAEIVMGIFTIAGAIVTVMNYFKM